MQHTSRSKRRTLSTARRSWIVVLAAIAAMGMASGVLTKSWFEGSASPDDSDLRVSARIGLWGQGTVTICSAATCETQSGTVSIDDRGVDADAKLGIVAGRIGYIAGVLASGAMLVLAVLLLVGDGRARKMRHAGWILCAAAAGWAGLFLILIGPDNELDVGLSAIVFFVGAAAGLIAALLIPAPRLRRPDALDRNPVAAPPVGQILDPAPVIPTPNPSSAQTAGIALLVCALVMAVGMFTNGWASATEGRDTLSAGLLELEECHPTRGCRTRDWGWASERLEIPSDVDTFRVLGMLSGLATIAVLIAAGVMALGDKRSKIPLTAFGVPTGIAGFCLTTFAFRLVMADHDVRFGPSYSAFITIGALLAAGFVFQYAIKPAVDQAKLSTTHAAATHPQHPTGHGCASCGSALQFAHQYQRWYCGACQHYV